MTLHLVSTVCVTDTFFSWYFLQSQHVSIRPIIKCISNFKRLVKFTQEKLNVIFHFSGTNI